MNFSAAFIIILLIVLLNILIYMIFKKFLYKKPDAAMRFLVINIAKDILWLGFSLFIIDKTRANFLFLVICFLASSFFIYYLVIRAVNKS
ncbi:hypothetical protein SAMN05216273_11051 [Chryseobacterium taihuense]|uniref:Uncharacterized protein n=1 Tax=Chryseobacterium taihuense TaxID=1141221 RepID=A0ABY0QVV7_9FLAO|nr:hypothetical protein SAMN05216273_11051 [Chryseobacterium taihuense]